MEELPVLNCHIQPVFAASPLAATAPCRSRVATSRPRSEILQPPCCLRRAAAHSTWQSCRENFGQAKHWNTGNHWGIKIWTCEFCLLLIDMVKKPGAYKDVHMCIICISIHIKLYTVYSISVNDTCTHVILIKVSSISRFSTVPLCMVPLCMDDIPNVNPWKTGNLVITCNCWFKPCFSEFIRICWTNDDIT